MALDNTKFSIIIPVYNVEQYLEKCIKSVLIQEYTDYEIILINDGSTDSSLSICNMYANKYKNIKVITQQNQGSSIARNNGLKNAIGEYVLYLDSDDYWDNTSALTDLVAKTSAKPEVILYGNKEYNCIIEKTHIKSAYTDLSIFESNDKESIMTYLFDNNLFPGAAWKMAIKRSFLIANNIIFKKEIKAEDIDWLIHVFIKVKYIEAIDNPFYVYLKNRPNSITFTADLKSIEGIYYALDKWMDTLIKQKNNTSNWLLNFLSRHYYASLIIYSKLQGSDKKKAFEMLKSRKKIIKYSKTKSNKFVRFVIMVLGLKLTSKLLSYIYFRKNN